MTDQKCNRGEKCCFSLELSKGDAVITWLKDGKEIKLSDHFQLSIDGKIQRLMIYNCQMEDAGVYKAVVGKTESTASLQVEIERDFVKGLPSKLDAIVGTDVELSV